MHLDFAIVQVVDLRRREVRIIGLEATPDPISVDVPNALELSGRQALALKLRELAGKIERGELAGPPPVTLTLEMSSHVKRAGDPEE